MATAGKQGDEFAFPDEKEEAARGAAAREDDEIEVQVVDDTPAADKGRRPLEKKVDDPTDEEIEGYSSAVKARIAELTHARHDERREKERLAREAQEMQEFTRRVMAENQNLRKGMNQSQTAAQANAKVAAEAALEKARRDLREAHEAFDNDKIVAAQEALADAKWQMKAVENFRAAPLQEEPDELEIQQGTSNRVKPDEKTLNWQAKNQWFGDPEFQSVTAYALGVHAELMQNGVDPRSDVYFETLDTRIKAKFPEVSSGDDDGGKPAARETPRKPSTVVAPAGRTATGKKTVVLTQTQLALAKKFGLTPQQYAAELVKTQGA